MSQSREHVPALGHARGRLPGSGRKLLIHFAPRAAPDQPPVNGLVDITQATRSILWLNNDYIVVYDRATPVTGSAGQFYEVRINRAAGTVDLLSDVRVLRGK